MKRARLTTMHQMTERDRKFWAPIPSVLAWVAASIPEGARVLEVGPGAQPFSRATVFVDWIAHRPIPNGQLVQCDFQREPLPFDDKAFDFVYCRHVLEDLFDPFWLCDEMSRVARAGYVEVPSPLSEICRGVDGASPRWRGYHHHRYFVWNSGGELRFLSKYPVVEYLQFGDERRITETLRAGPLAWNAYLRWDGRITYRYLQHDIDYHVARNYGEQILAAANESLVETRTLAALLRA
jgi:hypothetical protein